ncbi:MAG: HAMP domain-containing sensor histidine kinase [Syntrophomonadaceae bacterium]|nr:HAMP domain-containing sensor histidine kinase [Syntrophomonadaceae bacterium]
MIGSLRRKFILINMALVSLVLLIAFSAICASSYQRVKGDTFKVMRRMAEGEPGAAPPPLDIGERPPRPAAPMLPVFAVAVGEDGEVTAVSKEGVEVTDQLVQQVTARALATGSREGCLADLRLRFLRLDTPQGTRLAFADTSHEREQMASLLLTLSLVGAGGLAAFYLVSLFLSSWALRPVEKAWEQQKQFVADASHELRTPLAVILANTGILLSHRQDPIQQHLKWVEHTQAEAARMAELVEDLLFLARSDAPQAPQPHAPFHLSEELLGCVLRFESLAFEQGVSLASDIAPGIVLDGDRDQVRRLALILLDNACKYAGRGGEARVSLRAVHGHARLEVHNSGEPIPPQHLARIFERFYRPDDARSRGHGGYGLGLAIARAIVENHRGRISADSSAERGTTFVVELPLTWREPAGKGGGSR